MHYTILKYWVKLALRLFYYRHQVVGLEHVPKKGGVIFAGNHQNAPMDAFNIICNGQREPYFATRADLFKKDWMRKLLLSFKMYPVYRLSDGRKSMQENAKAFDFFSQKLVEGKSVGIFPEGQASYKYQLLPFKKGMARLALKSLEKNSELPIYIVPSGLQYERLHHYQADLLIQFGKPILVNDYFELYQEKPARAIKQLTLDTHQKLSELIIHIPDNDNYENINHRRKLIHQNTPGDLLNKFNTEKSNMYQEIKFNSNKKDSLFYYLLFPFLIIGFLFHYPIRKFIDDRTNKTIKDSQFLATSKFAHGFLIFPVYYLILALVIYFSSPIYCLFFLLIVPFCGRLAYRFSHSNS